MKEKYMELFEVNKRVDEVLKMLSEDTMFTDLLFIMTKKKDNEEKYIVGIEVGVDKFIYRPEEKKKTIAFKDIQIKRKYSYYLEPGIEAFIISKLNEGYSLYYMNIDTHGYLWNYIDHSLDVIEMVSKGLYSYLRFCKKTGINNQLLAYHTGLPVNDILYVFIENQFEDFDILISEDIGDKKLMLGVRHMILFNNQSRKQTEDITYRVTVLNKNDYSIDYNDYHGAVENAYADYKNHFFGLSYSYYIEKEKADDKTIKEFKKVIEEQSGKTFIIG